MVTSIFIAWRLLCREPYRSCCFERGAFVVRMTNSPFEPLSGDVGIILSVIEALSSSPGSSESSACIRPRPPNTPADGVCLDEALFIFARADWFSEVFSRSASSWLPHRLARVMGVSPNAFFMEVLAPLRTRNLAISLLDCWPQTRWRAVSPFWFWMSRLTLF